MMNQEVDKYLSGNMNPTEQKEFLKRTQQDAALHDEVIKMKNMQALIGMMEQPGDAQCTKDGFEGLASLIEQRNKRHSRINLWKYVAVAAVLVIATWIASSRYASFSESEQFTEIVVPKGQSVSLKLADGSKAWLSPLSKIRIPNQFNKKQRSVELDGEGYFAIAHDAERPFTVKTNQFNIQVLGTEFNVFAYSKLADKFEACLIKGQVKIYNVRNEKETIVLEPNEKVSLVNHRMVKLHSNFGDGESTKKGIFSFRMKSLEEIVNYLTLWYDVHFEIEGKVDLQRKISGKFSRNGDVSIVLEALKGVYDFNFRKIDDDNYVIYK